MNGKLIIALLITINCCYSICGAALRRTPKVYNALITTDENLTSSRAFPVIQPSIHEGGTTHYPFGPYSPYGIYTPPVVRFGQPIVPGLAPKTQAPSYPLPEGQFPPQFFHQGPGGSPFFYAGMQTPYGPTQFGSAQLPQNPPTEQTQETSTPQLEKQPLPPIEPEPIPANTPSPQNPTDTNTPQKMNKLPIPLNEFGLPPSLIPLPQHNNHFGNPSGLPPYTYQQFPLAYDTVHGGYRGYLPHFGYYPGNNFAAVPGGIPNFPSAVSQPTNNSPAVTYSPPPTEPTDIENDDATDNNDIFMSTEGATYTTEVNFENIKNGSKSKAKNVPDVPPPPIPSGAKSKQR